MKTYKKIICAGLLSITTLLSGCGSLAKARNERLDYAGLREQLEKQMPYLVKTGKDYNIASKD